MAGASSDPARRSSPAGRWTRARLGPPPAELVGPVVGDRPPVVRPLVAGRALDRQGEFLVRAPGGLHDRRRAELDTPEAAIVAAGWKEFLDRRADIEQDGLHVLPRARERRRPGRGRQEERADDCDGDEGRPAAEIDRADRGRVADPAPHPGRLLVESVEPDQQEQGREAEQDQVAELFADRRRHVADEDRSDDDDRAQRPAMAEDGGGGELTGAPAEQPEDQQVVARGARRRLPKDDQVVPGPDRRVRRRHELGPWSPPVIRQDAADHDRDDQRREGGPDGVGDPAAPAGLGPDKADSDPEEGRPGQEVRPFGPAQDPAGVTDRPGHRQGHHCDEEDARPAFLGCQFRAGQLHPTSASPSA